MFLLMLFHLFISLSPQRCHIISDEVRSLQTEIVELSETLKDLEQRSEEKERRLQERNVQLEKYGLFYLTLESYYTFELLCPPPPQYAYLRVPTLTPSVLIRQWSFV
jgi:hypothetical protein